MFYVMKRLLRGVFLVSVGALLIVGSAATLPSVRMDDSAAPARIKNTTLDATRDRVPGGSVSGVYFARAEWKTLPVEIPGGFWTILAGACMILPFSFSAWTLRKRT